MKRRGPSFSVPPPEPCRYTPARARRLATQARHLWGDMQSVVKEMLGLANEYDPDSLSEQRMALRAIENTLRGFTPEHRRWERLRQAGADRNHDHGLFRFMGEVASVVETRLDRLEIDIAEWAAGKWHTTDKSARLDLCSNIRRLRAIYSDWTQIFSLLDNLDYEGEDAMEGLEEDDAVLAAIELRTRQRRTPTKTDPVSPRRRPKRRTRR